MPVPTLVTFTAAPLTAAPEGSLTVPVIDPRSFWASARAAKKVNSATTKSTCRDHTRVMPASTTPNLINALPRYEGETIAGKQSSTHTPHTRGSSSFLLFRTAKFERAGSSAEVSTLSVTVTPQSSYVAMISSLCYFAVTWHKGGSYPMSDRSQFLAEIDKITGRSVPHGSESLCKLLRYLSKHTLEKPGVHLKEYQIATEVFGRPADFDPQADSTIRVQAGRLRGKLSGYYTTEGADDPIVVDLPRGCYVLQFHHRSHGNGKGHGAADYESERATAIANRAGGWGIAIAVLSVLLTATLAMILNLWSKNTETSQANGEPPAPAAFQIFWSPFTAGPEEPWVVFSNAAFIGRPETGMRYFDSTRDRKSQIWDHYTGVGEVLAVHELD